MAISLIFCCFHGIILPFLVLSLHDLMWQTYMIYILFFVEGITLYGLYESDDTPNECIFMPVYISYINTSCFLVMKKIKIKNKINK